MPNSGLLIISFALQSVSRCTLEKSYEILTISECVNNFDMVSKTGNGITGYDKCLAKKLEKRQPSFTRNKVENMFSTALLRNSSALSNQSVASDVADK